MEGTPPRRLHRLFWPLEASVAARDGTTIILKIAGNRQMLGLSAVARAAINGYSNHH